LTRLTRLWYQEIYQVETSAKQENIPKGWTKSGSTKAAKRWAVPELTHPIRQLKEARENRNAAVKNFRYRLYAEFDADRAVWLSAVKVMAELDCLFSLAKSSVAIGEPACRPEFVEADSAFVDFQELRHPALNIKGDFIPNDVRLGGEVGRIALLTGPNMA
jgi:DNA mismatch repair protein MSH6